MTQMTANTTTPPSTGTPWLWLLALGAIGAGAFVWGRRSERNKFEAGLDGLAGELEEAHSEANNKVRDAALATTDLSARLAQLAQRRAG